MYISVVMVMDEDQTLVHYTGSISGQSIELIYLTNDSQRLSS